jgi:anti-sigma B factor antagonist
MTLAIDVIDKGNNSYQVVLNGSLDSTTAPSLEARIGEFTGTAVAMVVFDLEHITFISSAGLRVIFKTLKLVKANNGKVGVSKMSAGVRKVFDIVKALPDMNIFASEAEMDDYLAAMQEQANEE